MLWRIRCLPGHKKVEKPDCLTANENLCEVCDADNSDRSIFHDQLTCHRKQRKALGRVTLSDKLKAETSYFASKHLIC